MKKTPLKLKLNRDTLLALENDLDVRRAAGGYTGGGPTCPHSCFHTICNCH